MAGEALDFGREGYEVLEIRISSHDALERGVVLVIPGEVVTGIGARGEKADFARLVAIDLADVRE